MKIRTNFVSNSSSASFVVELGNCYKNVFDLAIEMIEHQYSLDHKLISLINKSGKGRNTNISFHSCNYDTYIAKYDNFLLVSTCNNERFDEVIKNQMLIVPESIINELILKEEETCGKFEELEDIVPEHFKFWFPEYDLIGSKCKNYSFCKQHFTDYLHIEGQDICPMCYKEGLVTIEPLIPFNRFEIMDLEL